MTPAEQLLRPYAVPARHFRNREPARIRLRNDPRLGLTRPAPPTHASDHLDAPNSLGVKPMVAHMVKPIPQKESRTIPHHQSHRHAGKKSRLPLIKGLYESFGRGDIGGVI